MQAVMDEAELRKKIIAICTDTSLTEAEKAQKRQQLLSGKWAAPPADDSKGKYSKNSINVTPRVQSWVSCLHNLHLSHAVCIRMAPESGAFWCHQNCPIYTGISFIYRPIHWVLTEVHSYKSGICLDALEMAVQGSKVRTHWYILICPFDKLYEIGWPSFDSTIRSWSCTRQRLLCFRKHLWHQWIATPQSQVVPRKRARQMQRALQRMTRRPCLMRACNAPCAWSSAIAQSR